MKQAALIADIMDHTRQLTKYFIKQLDTDRLEERYAINGEQLNSAYWVIAHIIWAEHALVLQQLAGQPMDLPWVKAFGFGSTGELPEGRPDFKGLWAALNEVHENSMKFVRGMSDDELDVPLDTGNIPMPLWKNKREVLYHVIRHEGQHVGHISWICRFQGKKIV